MGNIDLGKKINLVIKLLRNEYPNAKIALDYTTPLELLVATVLSAQCTDKRVNLVSKNLFQKYKTVSDYAKANPKQFENEIRSTGFFRNKAKNIISTAKIIREKFNGQVPDSMEKLTSLPGIARKTANIILFNAFGKIEGIAVDTHVRRLSQRLGLSKNNDPVKIEKDLMEIVPRAQWGFFNYLLINHGRAICNAKKPLCQKCVINNYCDYYQKILD